MSPEGAVQPKSIEVTDELIREVMKDSQLSTTQTAVSKPVIQVYVDRILAGETNNIPAIQVDGSTIVGGNHRYIAGQITGIDIPTVNWTGSPKPIIEWQDIIIDALDWGNR